MFKPQKAKTYGKDKLKPQATDKWLVSIKYDGHQVFIVKHNGDVSLYTSGWKPFRHDLIKQQVKELHYDNFVLIGEFLYDCNGKLGCREKSAILTTFRTNWSKGLKNDLQDEQLSYVRIFDIVYINTKYNCLFTHHKANTRLNELYKYQTLNIYTILFSLCDFEEALHIANRVTKEGYEGVMCIHPDSEYMIGKRVHHAVKIKPRLTADLLCIDVTKGEGKYSDMIGSLVLQDKEGRVVNVGSGLTDSDRQYTAYYYIGSVVEIEYEKIADTYIQPVFKYIRRDKEPDDID
jgi:ATP-dependent DNA ligase